MYICAYIYIYMQIYIYIFVHFSLRTFRFVTRNKRIMISFSLSSSLLYSDLFMRVNIKASGKRPNKHEKHRHILKQERKKRKRKIQAKKLQFFMVDSRVLYSNLSLFDLVFLSVIAPSVTSRVIVVPLLISLSLSNIYTDQNN